LSLIFPSVSDEVDGFPAISLRFFLIVKGCVSQLFHFPPWLKDDACGGGPGEFPDFV